MHNGEGETAGDDYVQSVSDRFSQGVFKGVVGCTKVRIRVTVMF